MNPRAFQAFSVLSLLLLLLPLSACNNAESLIGEWTLETQGRYTRLIFSADGAVAIYTQSGLAGTGQWRLEGLSDILRIEFRGEYWSGTYSSESLAFQSKGREPTIYRKSDF